MIPIVKCNNVVYGKSCSEILEGNLRILKKSIRERLVKYKRGSKAILEIRKAASKCSYKNMVKYCYLYKKTDFFCEYIKYITDKIDKVRKMWFVSSTFKNLDEVNKWLKKANDKFKNTKQENITLENLDISYVRGRDSHPIFSNIMKYLL